MLKTLQFKTIMNLATEEGSKKWFWNWLLRFYLGDLKVLIKFIKLKMWFHFKNPTLRGNWIILIKVIDKWPYVTNEAVLLVAADACKAEVKEIEKNVEKVTWKIQLHVTSEDDNVHD